MFENIIKYQISCQAIALGAMFTYATLINAATLFTITGFTNTLGFHD